MQFWITPFGA